MIKFDTKALKAGDVHIADLTLVCDSGIRMSLIPQFVELNIYESLFTNFTTGTLIVRDGLNLIDKLPIAGNERLVITFISAGRETPYTGEFQVYGISDRIVTKESEQVYHINFICPLAISNRLTRVSHSYSDTPDAIVRDIFNATFGRIPTTDKRSLNQLVVNESIPFQMKAVIPNKTAVDAINWIASHAYTIDPASPNAFVPDLMFYQTREGFHFASLSSLAKQPVRAVYNRSNANYRRGAELDVSRELSIVQNIYFEKSWHKVRQLDYGLHASTLISVDPLFQTVKQHRFSYLEYFNQTSHIYPNPLEQARPDRDGLILSDSEGRTDYVVPEQAMSIYGDDRKEYPKFFLQRKSILEAYNTNVIQLIVPGDSDRTVGEKVYFKFPSAEAQSIEETEDKYFSGEYVITSLRHVVTPRNYQVVMNVSRDCLKTPLPQQSEFVD